MKDQKVFDVRRDHPMLATHGSVSALQGRASGPSKASGTATGCWSRPTTATLRLTSRSGREVTGEFPQLRTLAADLADHHVVLDGEVVALD